MVSYFSDLFSVLKGDFIDLDKTEAALLGAPKGETISIWAALESKHGKLLAHIACFVFSILIQWDHCKKQLTNAPMFFENYLRASFGLLIFAAFLLFLFLGLLKIFCLFFIFFSKPLG